jgi:hypothetical protein
VRASLAENKGERGHAVLSAAQLVLMFAQRAPSLAHFSCAVLARAAVAEADGVSEKLTLRASSLAVRHFRR